jgi:hypothetical protein
MPPDVIYRPYSSLMQVLCNAAKADKARLQQLEVEVARHSHRADTAEHECQELRKKLHMAEVCPRCSSVCLLPAVHAITIM